jgi:glycosyltransferase involved in cell wall biosynthesis
VNLVFFTHPTFFQGQSMTRFAKMLAEGMSRRGHNTQLWAPQPKFYYFPCAKSIKKWLGYIDQYLLFPCQARKQIMQQSPDTLFVFTDQALGAWVPLIKGRPHVIHCHDLLAQRSALGEFPENRTSWTGRIYQRYLYRGYSNGSFFISISQKTKEDLHRFLIVPPLCSEVIYNGLNQPFEPQELSFARSALIKELKRDLTAGYILHVGGNAWYKNRPGVIEIYNAWRLINTQKLPLLMIGELPSRELMKAYNGSPFKDDIYLLSDVNNDLVRFAYAGASVFLFPSLGEGFGWPIAEAMASGCPVITTNEAPMTEVAGNAGFYISRKPSDQFALKDWSIKAARVMDHVLNLSAVERQAVVKKGLANVKRFDTENMLDRVENIYIKVLLNYYHTNLNSPCAAYSAR